MSEYLTQLTAQFQEHEAIIFVSSLVLISLFFIRLFTTKARQPPMLYPPGISRRGEKAKPEIVIDLEKLHNGLITMKEQPKESSCSYEPGLHQFNVKIKEEYSKRPNLTPFDVLKEMKSNNLVPDITTYNTLLDICFEQKNEETAFKLFHQMKSLNFESNISDNEAKYFVDVISYNTVLKGLSMQINEKKSFEENRSVIDKILELLREIKESHIKPNHITYNTVIDACVKADEMEFAFQYFDEMKEQNLNPDNFTYATLIKGIKNHHNHHLKEFKEFTFTKKKNDYCQKDDSNLSKVFEILTSCKQGKSAKPDEILLNCVMDACIKFKNLPKALEIFEEMQNLDIKPSSITFGILIKGYGNEKYFNGVMQMYHKMYADKIKLNEVTYGCLIDASIKCNRMDQAMIFFNSMKQDADIKINSIIYSILIKGFTHDRNFDKAYEVYFHMVRRSDITFNVITFNAMLECAIKCNKSEKLIEIYHDIQKRGTEGKLQPDLITYSTYIKGLCKFKRVDDAFLIYEKLRRENIFKLDEVLYNSLLHGLQKAKEYEKAHEIYQHMTKNNIQPSNITYSILIKILSDQYKVEEALDLFSKIKETSSPSLILYTCIIQACIRSKKIDLVYNLYQEMRRNHIECDEVLYNTIISGFTFNNQLKTAIEILFETFDKRMKLNEEVYANVLKNIYKRMNANPIYSNMTRSEYEDVLVKIHKTLEDMHIHIPNDMLEDSPSNYAKHLGNNNSQGQFSPRNDWVRRRSEGTSNKKNQTTPYKAVSRRTVY